MRQVRFFIDAMDCPTEEQILRNGLRNHAAVQNLDFDLMNRVLTVTLRTGSEPAAVQATLAKLGMPGELREDGNTAAMLNGIAINTRIDIRSPIVHARIISTNIAPRMVIR